MNTEQQLIEKWRNLPSDKQQQVLQFVESLDQHKQEIKQRPFGLCKGELGASQLCKNRGTTKRE